MDTLAKKRQVSLNKHFIILTAVNEKHSQNSESHKELGEVLMDRTKYQKIGNIAGNIILYLFLAICVFSLIVTIFSRKERDGAVELFGYQMRIVSSNSMAKCDRTDVSEYEIKSIPLRSMVFIQVMPKDEAEAEQWYATLQVGDVLTFKYVYTSQMVITHRITAITPKDTGGYIIELAGDNINADTTQLTQTIDTSIPDSTNYVIGKVRGQAYLPGVLLSVLKKPVGIICVVTVPCCIIILMEITKIVGVYQAERKQREREERQQKDREIETLRSRLAQLENLQK